MRKIVFVALSACTVAAVCFTVSSALPHNDMASLPFFDGWDFGKPRCQGSRSDQSVATRDFEWSGGDSVGISVPGTIRYRRGTGEKVTVRAKGWVLDHITVDDGHIAYDCRNVTNAGMVEVTLPGIPMRSFSISGAGKLYLEDVQQPELKIALSGAAKIEASGQADDASVSIAGVGEVDMGRLIAKRMSVSIAGTGDVDVAPQDAATISIAGAGRVRLLTEPKELSTHIAGAGRIVHGAR